MFNGGSSNSSNCFNRTENLLNRFNMFVELKKLNSLWFSLNANFRTLFWLGSEKVVFDLVDLQSYNKRML